MDPAELVYRVNFHFDGFLHVIGSAMDIFARELLGYFNIPLPAKVYFHVARDQITAQRAGDPILPLLVAPSWKAEFSDYRNTATHERLIGVEYTRKTHMKGGAPTFQLIFPIPDDPRAATYTFRKNPDIVDYCKKTFMRTVSCFNQVYTHIEHRAKVAGALPL